MTTVAVAMIVRDSAATMAAALASIHGHVDEIVVIDTGSVDNTIQVAGYYGAIVSGLAWRDDFSYARQAAFNACASEWIMWLDADDLVEGAEHIRTVCDNVPEGTNAIYWNYVTAVDAYGNVTQANWRERCVLAGTHIWAGRVHEVLIAPAGQRMIREASVVIHHTPVAGRDEQANLGRNVRILRQMAAEQDPPQSRTFFYLGRDLLALGHLDEAQSVLERYRAIATWPDELYFAHQLLANIYRIKKRWEDARQADLDATELKPLWPNAWFGLAQTAYFQEEWELCVFYCRAGKLCPAPDSVLFMSPRTYEYEWLIYYVVALSRLGHYEEALQVTRRALELVPDAEQHTLNLVELQHLLDAGDGQTKVVYEPAEVIS